MTPSILTRPQAFSCCASKLTFSSSGILDHIQLSERAPKSRHCVLAQVANLQLFQLRLGVRMRSTSFLFQHCHFGFHVPHDFSRKIRDALLEFPSAALRFFIFFSLAKPGRSIPIVGFRASSSSIPAGRAKSISILEAREAASSSTQRRMAVCREKTVTDVSRYLV